VFKEVNADGRLRSSNSTVVWYGERIVGSLQEGGELLKREKLSLILSDLKTSDGGQEGWYAGNFFSLRLAQAMLRKKLNKKKKLEGAGRKGRIATLLKGLCAFRSTEKKL